MSRREVQQVDIRQARSGKLLQIVGWLMIACGLFSIMAGAPVGSLLIPLGAIVAWCGRAKAWWNWG